MKGTLLPDWIEQRRHDQLFHLGQQALKLLEDLPASQGEFETMRRADQKVVLKHCARALQRPAYSRLAQQ